jgi:UDP-N-acetylmuramoylalanine--D-glutamate ligase
VALMRAAGLGDEAIRKAFVRFEPLPHRMQTVGTFGGVTWIDDSKATSLAALVAGVTMAAARVQGDAQRVPLIAGGQPKGDDPAIALDALKKWVRRVYLIGECATALEAAWRDAVPCEMCGTLDVAVQSAALAAKEGECVLLSPGAASFDQFRSYGERGDAFARLASR